MSAEAASPPFDNFASDNNAGACPEALAALMAANASGHVGGYGEDRWTHEVCDRMRALFETDCDVYFVFNGTAANSLALASLCRPFHSVICHEAAHVETDECGAPGFFSNGSVLMPSGGENGKLRPEAIETLATKRRDIHYPKPRAVTVSQSTELGSVYAPVELRGVSEMAKRYGMRLHMDGARFANAMAALEGCSPADATWRAGVDVLCFGGAKNGLPLGEAVVFFDHALAEDFAYRAKQGGQLCSKMRFISAPWIGLLENDVWLKNARHANTMAQELKRGAETIDGVRIAYPCEANAVFLDMPTTAAQRLRRKGWRFYDFIGGRSRLMCSWDTRPETVARFVADLEQAVAAG